MDALVAANPGYKWELNDSVVNLMEKSAPALLRTRIAKFQISATDKEIPAVLQQVLRLPEVREREAVLGIKHPDIAQDGRAGPLDIHPVPRQPVPVHIDLQNLPLQEVFDKIIEASPKGVWIYHETDCNRAKTFVVRMISDY